MLHIAAQPASAGPSTASAVPLPHNSADNQPIAAGVAPSAAPPDEPTKADAPISKVEAQTLAAVRPPPPPARRARPTRGYPGVRCCFLGLEQSMP